MRRRRKREKKREKKTENAIVQKWYGKFVEQVEKRKEFEVDRQANQS